MAKLSARGRSEIVRLRRDLPDSDNCTDCKETIALMTDGTILQKHSVKFKPDQFNPEGRSHNWGWKVKGKIKKELRNDPQLRDRFVDLYSKRGFTVTDR